MTNPNPNLSQRGSEIGQRKQGEVSETSLSLQRNEDRGDLLIRGPWARGMDCNIDVQLTDVDAKFNWSKDPHKVLVAAHQLEKRRRNTLGLA